MREATPRRRWIACLGALAACAGLGPLPPWYTAANIDHPRFSRARFVTGVGLSTSSPADADARARANVAAQISAQVQSVATPDATFAGRGGDAGESVPLRAAPRSDFERPDLIRIAERERQGDAYYSYAVLDREAADRGLAAQSEPVLAKFQSASAAARLARAHRDAGMFAAAAAEALRARAVLDARFLVRRAITGREAEGQRDYDAIRKELLASVDEARANRVVGVLFTSRASGGVLGDLAINAIKRLGLRPDSTPCKDRDERTRADATELAVVPEENCMEFTLGERCEVAVHLVAQACSGDTSSAGTVPQVRGMHPTDRDKARRNAWDKVTQQAVETAVRDALRSALAIGGDGQ